jgi:hypothetical protein
MWPGSNDRFLLVDALLERFQNSRARGRPVKGGVYFHPTDEDLSVGTPDRKTPLGIQAPGYSNSGTAIAAGCSRGFWRGSLRRRETAKTAMNESTIRRLS